MKKVLIALTAVISAILFSFSASAAESVNDLTKIYNNLMQYLYTPFFENSELYPAFDENLKKVGELLKQESITQTDIDQHYNDIKKAYSELMKSTFDYTELESLLSEHEKLDGSIFTEESWRRVVSIIDTVNHELDAPSLFQKTANATREDYVALINKHIAKYTQNYIAAYNRLELALPEYGEVTKEDLDAYLRFTAFTAREDLMGNLPQWNHYESACIEARYCMSLGYPRQERLDTALQSLQTTYLNLTAAALDMTPIKKQISRYSTLSGASFSTASWANYSERINELNLLLDQPHYIFLPENLSTEECLVRIENYFNTLCLDAETAYQSLISLERYEYLKKLCNENRDRTSMEGLEVKLKRLLNRVAEADQILQNPNALPQEVETAIENLENAKNDLVLAEGFLLEEKSKVIKQDAFTVKMIVLTTFLVLGLSLIFACVISKLFYGRIDWKK